MTSDAVTYIMGTKNHHMWAYIDDYILVGSKEATEGAFHDLSIMLTEVGFQMNWEKRTPNQSSNMPRHSHCHSW